MECGARPNPRNGADELAVYPARRLVGTIVPELITRRKKTPYDIKGRFGGARGKASYSIIIKNKCTQKFERTTVNTPSINALHTNSGYIVEIQHKPITLADV